MWESSSERVVGRECAWCGQAFVPGLRGQHQRYCTRGCRQRAYEVRTAERRQAAAVEAGTARPDGPVREVVERHTVRTVVRAAQAAPMPVPVPAAPAARSGPPRAREVQEQMRAAAAAVRTGRIGHWDHRHLYGAAAELLAALDSAHPGGLEALRGRR